MPARRLLPVLPILLVAAGLLTASRAWAADGPPNATDGSPQGEYTRAPECAGDIDGEVTLDLGVYSMYVWRGLRIVDGFVAQPTLDVSACGFALNVWANFDLEDTNGEQGKFTEVDLTGSYTFAIQRFDVTLGAVTYLFPTGEDQTTELFAGVTLDVPLSPTITVYQDIDAVEGTYIALSGSYTLEDPFCWGECRGVSPELDASIGWGSKDHNRAYYDSDTNGFADLTLGLIVPYRLTRQATVAASIHWSSLLDGALRDAVSHPDSLWFGLSLTFSF
jgi:hypothetical protein